jgi:hypothetical protein
MEGYQFWKEKSIRIIDYVKIQKSRLQEESNELTAQYFGVVMKWDIQKMSICRLRGTIISFEAFHWFGL